MIVVADSGPLHYLILLEHIELPRRFYGHIAAHGSDPAAYRSDFVVGSEDRPLSIALPRPRRRRRFESRKTGKAGYAPACANEWVRGVCEKPRIKCAECPNRRFFPVTDELGPPIVVHAAVCTEPRVVLHFPPLVSPPTTGSYGGESAM